MKLQKGYSVVELVLVVAVLGVVFAIAVPNLMRANRNKKLIETGREIVHLLQEAKFKAVADNSSKKVIINTNNNTIQASTGMLLTLPSDVHFTTLPGNIEAPQQVKTAVDQAAALATQKDDAKISASFADGTATGIFQAEFDAKGLPNVEPGVVNWVYLENGEGLKLAVIMTSAGACEVLQYNSSSQTWK